MQIDAHKRSLEEILKVGQHIIPRYQRSYAWDEQNIRDFYTDLMSTTEPYFLGSMVVSGAASKPREVIDGQQRLTSALIALAVLRDQYYEREQHDRVMGIKTFLQYTDRDGDSKARLINYEQAAQERLYNNALTEPEKLMPNARVTDDSLERRAYITFEKCLQTSMSESESPLDVLDQFRDRVLEATVVYINVEDKKSAFTIFETLNDRGQSLRTIDLVKNLLISNLTNEGDEDPVGEIGNCWSQIVGTVDKCAFEGLTHDLFLYYFWNSKSLDTSRPVDTIEQTRIRRSISDLIDRSENKKSAAKVVLTEMHEAAQILGCFSKILSGMGPLAWKELDDRFRKDKDKNFLKDKYDFISARLYGILVTGSLQPLPLLISLTRAFLISKHRIKKATFEEFLILIENFQFRWSISKKGSTSTIRRLYRMTASKVDSSSDANGFMEALKYFWEGSMKLMPTNNQFKDGLERLEYSKGARKDVFKIRYILTRIEKASGDSLLSFDESLSIEHLEALNQRSEASARNRWIFKLGNLTLLPPGVNSRLPDKFSEKAAILSKWVRKSDESLQMAIADKIWNSERSKERMGNLIKTCFEIWPNEQPSISES